MIDFKNAEESFKDYLKDYDLKDGNIKLKVKHTYEVVRKSENISKGLGLEKEDIELAKVIALLHDIGRFEQVKQTNDFVDSNGFDHAEYGIRILFEKGMIRNFIAIDKADKLDNFRVKELEDFKNIFPGKYNSETINYESISLKVYNDFINCKCIRTEDRKTQIDFWISFIAFIFDLNFDISLNYIKEKNYIDVLIDRIEYKNSDTKEKMEAIRKCAKTYINKSKSKKIS